MDERRKERISMAREICLHRGENPNIIDRNGNQSWEKYEPLAGAAIREAERLFALRSAPRVPAQCAMERPSTSAMYDLIRAIIEDDASYDAATNTWDTAKAATAIVAAFDGEPTSVVSSTTTGGSSMIGVGMLNAMHCVICGATDYALSCGGPTICPKCDCGNFDAATVEMQAKVIIALRQEIESLRRPAQPQPSPVVEDARHEVANWMIGEGYVTGHGNTLDDLMQELVTQAQQAVLAGAAQGRQEPEACPYAIDGCVLENQEIGPCLCALTSTDGGAK